MRPLRPDEQPEIPPGDRYAVSQMMCHTTCIVRGGEGMLQRLMLCSLSQLALLHMLLLALCMHLPKNSRQNSDLHAHTEAGACLLCLRHILAICDHGRTTGNLALVLFQEPSTQGA